MCKIAIFGRILKGWVPLSDVGYGGPSVGSREGAREKLVPGQGVIKSVESQIAETLFSSAM